MGQHAQEEDGVREGGGASPIACLQPTGGGHNPARRGLPAGLYRCTGAVRIGQGTGQHRHQAGGGPCRAHTPRFWPASSMRIAGRLI
jgi:hypothetical protein